MKKILSVLIIVIISFSSKDLKDASANHLAFQSMDIYGGKLLKDYTDEDYSQYYKKVNNRKFAGWNAYELSNGAKTYYISHTVFSYYNTGTSAIEYTYTSTVTSTKKISYSASGTIKFNASGTVKGFKGGLDTTLKLDYSNDETVVEKEEIKMTFKCDPDTRVIMYIAGEGYLYNGVAKKYFFWCNTETGGYEYFITATEYQVLEKVDIS